MFVFVSWCLVTLFFSYVLSAILLKKTNKPFVSTLSFMIFAEIIMYCFYPYATLLLSSSYVAGSGWDMFFMFVMIMFLPLSFIISAPIIFFFFRSNVKQGNYIKSRTIKIALGAFVLLLLFLTVPSLVLGLAKVTKVPEFCKLELTGSARANCLDKVSKDKSDTATCLLYSHPGDKTNCVFNIAIQKDDASICYVIERNNYNCFQRMAFAKNDTSICELIERTDMKEYCLCMLIKGKDKWEYCNCQVGSNKYSPSCKSN
ncbi:hypothetical protein CMO93_01630 [Candidatus Woesearchaeota archaeon]|nr:hypothetical protein [Candidatus Woesearchaeota archaeon]